MTQFRRSHNFVAREGYISTASVTPNDTTDLAVPADAIYVGVTGDVTLYDGAANSILFKAVPAGTVLQVVTRRVMATNTTASQIVALYY